MTEQFIDYLIFAMLLAAFLMVGLAFTPDLRRQRARDMRGWYGRRR